MRKNCISCGREFEAKRSDAKYCSKNCRQNSSLRKKRGSFSKKTCPVCGKEFKGPNHQKYCSEDCYEWADRLQTFRRNEDRYDPLNWIDDEDPFDSLG